MSVSLLIQVMSEVVQGEAHVRVSERVSEGMRERERERDAAVVGAVVLSLSRCVSE